MTCRPGGATGRRQAAHDEAARFILRVGVAAHCYGATAIRLETVLSELARFLGLLGVFRSSPSEIVLALRESSGEAQRIEIIPIALPDVQLDKLARLGELLGDLAASRATLAEASDRLDAIERAPLPWGAFGVASRYVCVALGLTPLLGGSWTETLLAGFLSVPVFRHRRAWGRSARG